MVDEMETQKDKNDLARSLEGPLLTLGPTIDREDEGAPIWWHGDDEAFEAAEIVMAQLPRRR